MHWRKVLEWLKRATLWGVLSYGGGAILGLFSAGGVPEGAMAGRPLQEVGFSEILIAFVFVGVISWLQPPISWLVVILFELGWLTILGHRLRVHTNSVYPYGTALTMTAPVVVAALLGAVGGTWLGTMKAGKAAREWVSAHGLDWWVSKKPLVSLAIALVLLVGGAGPASIPIIGLLGFPLAILGASLVGRVAFAFGDPGAHRGRRRIGAAILIVGTVALLVSCLDSVNDIHSHVLSAMRQEMISLPDLRFVAGWRPSIYLVVLWLSAPCMLVLGVKLRNRVSRNALILLFVYLLASAPLASLVFLWLYLRGAPLSA